jgi:hypothetical protein
MYVATTFAILLNEESSGAKALSAQVHPDRPLWACTSLSERFGPALR